MFNFILISSLFLLLAVVFLPFWYAVPRVSKDRKVIKDVLPPGTRRYTLILPTGYAEKISSPLIVGLHYGGHGLPFYGEFFLKDLVEPIFRPLDAILVAPDCPANNWTQVDSTQFVDDLIQNLIAQYNIDTKRILVVGYSMGGIGAWHFGLKRPNPYSAAVIMAARPPDAINIRTWDLPVFVIHGKKDELFPIADTTRVVLSLEDAGADINYRIIEDGTHFEAYQYMRFLEEINTWLLERWDQ